MIRPENEKNEEGEKFSSALTSLDPVKIYSRQRARNIDLQHLFRYCCIE